MATANDFAVANSYLPPKKPVLGQNELAVWVFVLKVLGKVKQRAKFQYRIYMHRAVMRIQYVFCIDFPL